MFYNWAFSCNQDFTKVNSFEKFRFSNTCIHGSYLRMYRSTVQSLIHGVTLLLFMHIGKNGSVITQIVNKELKYQRKFFLL